MNRAGLAPPRKPPPEKRRPAERETPTGQGKEQRGTEEFTPGARQAQAQHLAELMTAAAERGDREANERHWQALRKLLLTRPAAEVHAMEVAMGLRGADE